jgi:hypothetical protein
VRTQRLGGVGALAAAAAVTATVLLVTPVESGIGNRISAPPPVATAPEPAPLFTFTFRGYSAGQFRVVDPHEVTPAYQDATILGPATHDGKPITAAVGSLTVYQPGAFNPAKVRAGTKLAVLGRDAYEASFERHLLQFWNVDGTPGGTRAITAVVLAWQYGENAWATVTSESFYPDGQIPLADKIKLAEQLRFGERVRARIPFRPWYLPAGWALQSASGRGFATEDTGTVRAVYAPADTTFDALTEPRSFDQYTAGPSVIIAIAQQDTPPPDAPKKKDICIAGEHWCTWPLPGTGYYIAVHDPSKTLLDGELLRIGQSLTFADLNDPTTWPPVG